jgi:hypothetical protein
MFTESLAKIQVVNLPNKLMSVYICGQLMSVYICGQLQSICRPTYYSFSENILSHKESIHFMIFEVNIRLTVFWNVTPCSPLGSY